MKQTITINPAPQEKTERSYPYMGIAKNGTIVWFVAPREGIAIKQHLGFGTTEIAPGWIESQFTPLNNQTITFKMEGAE